MISKTSAKVRGQNTTNSIHGHNNAEKQRNIGYIAAMIRVLGITVGLVILTVGGGIGLSNAHGSAGKAAISTPDPFEPDNAELRRIPLSVKKELTADAPAAEDMSHVVAKDVSRANVMRWRLFGSTLAPETGKRPKSRSKAPTQTAHASSDLVFDAPVISSGVTPVLAPLPQKRVLAVPPVQTQPVKKHRSMNDNPNPGFLIGVFR